MIDLFYTRAVPLSVVLEERRHVRWKNGDSLTRKHRLRVYSHSALHNGHWRLGTITLGTTWTEQLFSSSSAGTGARTSDWLFVNRIVCQQPSAHYTARVMHLPSVRDRSTRPSFDLFFFVTTIYLQYTSVLQHGKNVYRATLNYTTDANCDNQSRWHSLSRVKSPTSTIIYLESLTNSGTKNCPYWLVYILYALQYSRFTVYNSTNNFDLIARCYRVSCIR